MMTDLAWQPSGDLERRVYASYEDYLAHQRAKRDRMSSRALTTYETRYVAALQPRLASDFIAPGSRVVCLGARGGAEVRTFRALGCLATGLDLNPGPDNPDVLVGDFHALPYDDGTVAIVFMNALDHCYDLDRVLTEVRRVLSPDGRFIVEAVRGTREGCAPAAYESLAWATIDALVTIIEARGFRCGRRSDFTIPWPGEHLVLHRTEAA